jgi:hypothetical protein
VRRHQGIEAIIIAAEGWNHVMPRMGSSQFLHTFEESSVELAVRVLGPHIAMDRVGPHGTPSMADTQIVALDAVLLLNQHPGPFLKSSAGITVPED